MPSSPSCMRGGRRRHHPRVLKMLVQTHAVAALPQDAGQRRLAHLDRFRSQIRAVQLDQVRPPVWQVFGFDPEFVPSRWYGLAGWLEAGLRGGWKPALVIARLRSFQRQ
jgi:hypothetical protein